MTAQFHCDAPDCINVLPPDPEDADEWYVAELSVSSMGTCAAEDCDGLAWGTEGDRIDACSREHLRIALAEKIAELTDEHVIEG